MMSNDNLVTCKLTRQYNLYELRCEDPPCSIVVQVDYEYPFLARLLGWEGKVQGERCNHYGTDGTVNCPDCGMAVAAFIQAAQDYLDFMEGSVEVSEDVLVDYV